MSVSFSLAFISALCLLPFQVGAEDYIPIQKGINLIRAAIPGLCQQPRYSSCFNMSQTTCVSRISGAFDQCVKSERRTVIPASERSSWSHALDQCVGRQFMASNSPYDQQSADCIYLQSTPSPQAVAPAEMEDDLARDYLVKVQADTEFSKSLQNQLLHSPKSLCPGDSVKSACFKKVLNSIQITSTPQVVLLSLIATSASFDDQKNHVPDADLRLLDNLLLILERTSLTQFHLSRMQAVTPVQRISLKMLKSDDEKLIAQQVVTKMLPMIDKKMSEFQKTRAPASVASYRVEKLSELKRRLETLRRRTWSYHF